MQTEACAALWSLQERMPRYCLRQFLKGMKHAMLHGRGEQKEVALDLIAHLCTGTWGHIIAQELPNVLPIVSLLMTDAKPDVRAKAGEAMGRLFKCCGNKDLIDGESEGFLQWILKANGDLKDVPECIEHLAGCVFVQTVE